MVTIIFSKFIPNITWQNLIFWTILGFVIGGMNDWMDFNIFPDLQHRNQKTHSVFSSILISILISTVFLYWFKLIFLLRLAISGTITWISHLFLDAFNFTGIWLLPMMKVGGKVHYQSYIGNLIPILVGICFIFLGYYQIFQLSN